MSPSAQLPLRDLLPRQHAGPPRQAGICGVMTPDWSEDPEPVPYADLGDPQTLNLYAYGRNNPVTSADSDGHTPVDDVWMATGHMMQEVGIESFHLWAGQDEGQDKDRPRAIAAAPGAVLPIVMTGGSTEVTVTATAAETLNPAALLAIDGLLLRYDYHQFYQLGEAYGWWQGPVVLPPPMLHASRAKSSAQDKRLTDGEVKRLKKNSGRTAEKIKADTLSGRARVGGYDLYKTPDGEIVGKPKDGAGPGEPTGYTVDDLN